MHTFFGLYFPCNNVVFLACNVILDIGNYFDDTEKVKAKGRNNEMAVSIYLRPKTVRRMQ